MRTLFAARDINRRDMPMLKTAWLIGFLMMTWNYIGYPLCKRRFEGRKGRRLFGALALGAIGL